MRNLGMLQQLQVAQMVGTETEGSELVPGSFIQPSTVELQHMPGNAFLLPSSHLVRPGKDPQNSVVQNDPHHESLTDLIMHSKLLFLSTHIAGTFQASCRHRSVPGQLGAPACLSWHTSAILCACSQVSIAMRALLGGVSWEWLEYALKLSG